MSPPPDSRREAGTRALLDALSDGPAEEALRLDTLFAGLGKRSFGMLLFVSTLPAFIPIPGMGGAISGPLSVLIGVQLLVGLRRPWLPGFIARRGPHRRSLQRFRDLLAPFLRWLERVVRPRAPALLDHRLAGAVSGVLIVLVGLLLALPIPLTNYLFGGLLLLFALALLERDGWLMLAAWLGGGASVTVFGVLSGRLAALAADWFQRIVG
ncbi:MAG TPA: exopolysaccharide biosynthesis protein [Lysobacter sp.]|nr:exopolysaccharide biosynthesis protein [Lysobacter sp.]